MRVAENDHVRFGTPPGRVKRALISRVRVGLALALLLSIFATPASSAVADWDEPTKALFTAIEAGDLVAVQRAVLDGAKLNATDDTGKTPSALAEELGHFTITTFLLAYTALEASPEQKSGGTSSASSGNAQQSTSATTIPAPPAPESVAMEAPPSEEQPVEEEIVSPVTGPVPDQIDKPFFERLTTLNPTPRQPATSSSSGSGIGAVVSGVDEEPAAPTVATAPTTPDPAPVSEPAFEPEFEIVEEAPPLPADVTDGGEGTVVTMIPAPAPGDDPTVEPEPLDLRAPAGQTTTATAPPEPAPTPKPVAPTKPVEQPTVTAKADPPASGGFLSGLRQFSGGEPGTLQPEDLAQPPAGATAEAEIPGPENYPAPVGARENVNGQPLRTRDATLDARVPEHERLRAEAVERLKQESVSRLAQLDDARKQASDERERTRQGEDFMAGVAKVEAEARAQERLALTGTPYPPGFVPPPDGGSSAIRFLQRMGIIAKEQPTGLAEVQEPRKSRDSRVGKMGPIVQADPEQALTPQDLRALSFIDSGYAAPPRGRNLDTDDDRSVGALQQIARLLSTPDARYPSQSSSLQSGQQDGQFPAGNVGGQTSAYGSAPQISNVPTAPAPAEPPPPTPGAGLAMASPEPAPPGDVPLPSAALDDLFPGTGQTEPAYGVTEGWGATTQDPGGDVVARAGQSAPEQPTDGRTGLVDRLSSLFDPAAPEAVGSGGPLRDADGNPPVISEPSGTWDVVAVEPAAPPPPRMLLGGPARQYEPRGDVRQELDLAIGRTVLGKGPPVQSDPTILRKSCVDKRRGTVTFCIEAADWPEQILPLMRVDTVMYQGASMISRYDNGVATRFYALYPSENFEQIVRYFASVLGEPSSIWKRSIAPLAQPRAENPTVTWKATNPGTQAVSVLEIRQYDDTRGGFPDEQRGAIMLYRAQAGPIFPQVSALELMRLRPGS